MTGTTTLAATVDDVTRKALASGALVPFEIAGEAIADDPPWRIEWVSSLARKDQAATPKPDTKPGAFNPFLPYDPALFVSALGAGHVLLLNKFPIRLGHVIVVTRAYADQEQPLERADFAALAQAMDALGGLAFFNGGATAGASVQHRHLQIAPFGAPLIEALLPSVRLDDAPQRLARLPFRHALVRFAARWPDNADRAGARLYEAYLHCREACGIAAGNDGRLPAYNLLATRDWFLLVPRSRETWEDGALRVSLNAMSFAGSIFVRDPALIPRIRDAGLMRLLGAVTCT
ncbi:MAG: phosphorylase [Pseudomonadota bacterium]